MTWDPTKPATNGALVSADIRAQWDAVQRSLAGKNLCLDPNFLIWPAESSAGAAQTTPPAHWSLAGTGATVTRCGSGLTDTTDLGLGGWTCKLTFGSATAQLYQTLFATLPTYFRGKPISASVPVKCSTGSAARIRIYDGVGSTYSSYHTGGSSTEQLTATRTLDASATTLVIYLELSSASCYTSGGTWVIGDIPPAFFVPGETILGHLFFPQPSTLATGTKKAVWPARAGIVKRVSLRCETAPATQAWIVDVNTWDGSAFTSMYSTRPQVAAAANGGKATPDSTYARRCLNTYDPSSLAAGMLLSVDTDQVGSGTAGADGVVEVDILTFRDPLAEWRP